MGYVYKFTIRDNKKWYIGSHNGSNEKYNGSGLLWKKALAKYGKDSYDIEILYEGDYYREKEEEILKQLNASEDLMSYNMKNESIGGSFPGEKNGMFGKKLSSEERYRCGSAFRGKKRPEHSEQMKGSTNPMYGRTEHAYGIIGRAKENKGKTYKEIYGEERAKQISQRLSNSQLGKSKPGTSAAMTGAGNSSAKPIIFNEIEYGCIKDAMKATGFSRYKIKKTCIYL